MSDTGTFSTTLVCPKVSVCDGQGVYVQENLTGLYRIHLEGFHLQTAGRSRKPVTRAVQKMPKKLPFPSWQVVGGQISCRGSWHPWLLARGAIAQRESSIRSKMEA